MKIKLLNDVYGEDRFGNKFIRTTVRTQSARRPQGLALAWVAGAEMEVSDATGQKMVDAGQAVKLVWTK